MIECSFLQHQGLSRSTSSELVLEYILCVYIHTHTHIYMECYSAIKREEIMPLADTWVGLQIVLLGEVRHRKMNII